MNDILEMLEELKNLHEVKEHKNKYYIKMYDENNNLLEEHIADTQNGARANNINYILASLDYEFDPGFTIVIKSDPSNGPVDDEYIVKPREESK